MPGGRPAVAEHEGIVEAVVDADGALRLKREAHGWRPWRQQLAYYPPGTWLRFTVSFDGMCVVNLAGVRH